MSYAPLKQRLDAGETLILDGATGTELQRRGAKMDATAWSAPVVLDDPKLLTDIHADYIRAGADIVTANTFSASRMLLAPAGYGDKVEEIIRRSVEVAQQARSSAAGGRPVAVAGSISHMVPVIQGGNRVDPARLPSDAAIGESFEELAQTLQKSGVDLIILEMMNRPNRIKLALKAALATGLPVWFGFSARKGKDGRVLSFDSTQDAPLDTVTSLVLEALKQLRASYKGPLMAYPDSGYFEMPDWRFVDVITPDRLEQFFRSWIDAGVQVIGGCCGLTTEHIKAAVAARDKSKKTAPRRPVA
jgi:homocysteine S-methyltransferase